jgi:hypothetical protein
VVSLSNHEQTYDTVCRQGREGGFLSNIGLSRKINS